MKINKYSLFIIFIVITLNTFAQRGKDGAKIISAANTIVNEYTSLASDAISGATSIVVANNNLNTNNRFTAALAAGDLIMIIQIQGAKIMDSIETRDWGKVLNYNNCGLYEFAEVLSVQGSDIINISCGLTNNYTAKGKVVVVRVPRYQTLTINNGGSLTVDTWNGTIGGILALEVLGNTIINTGGKIDISGKGFRGGILATKNSGYGIGEYYHPTDDFGKEKGEGIAGFEADYDLIGGRYCRGAAANGAGGGNAHNHGGGGGGNAGDTTLWTGLGNPDTSTATWKQAWDLEGSGYATSKTSSTGGGRGGYSFSSPSTPLPNPLTSGPWTPNNQTTAWSGDYRRIWGGLGGRPLDYTKGGIYMGGGGGAGDQDDGYGSSGANGGGIIYIQSFSTITGSGKIISNGATAANSSSGTGIGSGNGGADGAGGGGAGGTIIIKSIGVISVDSIIANGGNGGNQVIKSSNTTKEAEGPGGGGGGGYIATSNSTSIKLVKGGHNGVTNSYTLTKFPPNGATKGGDGLDTAKLKVFDILANNDTICAGNTASLTASLVGDYPVGTLITWYDAAVNGNVLGTGNTFITPVLSATTSYYVGSCPGTFNAVITAVVSGPKAEAGANVSICAGGNVQLNASGGTFYHWSPSTGLSNPNINNPIANPTITTMYYVTVSNVGGCSAFDSVKVTVGSLTANAGIDASICPGDSTTLQASGGTIYHWSPSTGLSNPNVFNPKASPTISTTYIVTVSDGSCSGVDSVIVSVHPAATVNAGNNDTICPGGSVQLSAFGNGTSYQWNPVTNLSNPNIPNPIATPSATTNYIVNVSNANNCKASDSVKIFVIQSIHAALSSASSLCLGDTIYFVDNSTSSSSSISNWFWNFGDGYSSSVESPSHIYTSIGQYTVTFIVENSKGCKDSVTKTITVNTKPIANYAVSDTSGCSPFTVNFTDQSVNGNIWEWNFNDPTSGTKDTSSSQNTSHVFNHAGLYNITLNVAALGNCSSTITHTVHIYPPSTAQFTATPNPVFVNNPVTINNTSTNSSNYIWTFGNGQNCLLPNPAAVLYSTPGTDTIKLVTISADGCKDTTDYVITVNDQINLIFPNVITPNGDGKNDYFVIKDLNKVPVNHLVVFNRWGKVVYEKDNYQNDWNGGGVADGVYYYILTYLGKETHGIITVLK